MKTSMALLFGAFASLALAQQDYRIDPNNVNITIRTQWCDSQKQQCPLICLQTPGNVGAEKNDCDPTKLQYNCICTDGKSPNITQYTQTLPYFICTEWGKECVANCGNNNLCQADCLQKHPCGAQSPTRVNLTSSTTASASKTGSATGSVVAASTTSAGAIYTGLAGGAAAASTSQGAAAAFQPMAVHFGQAWGLAVVVAGLFGAFAVLL